MTARRCPSCDRPKGESTYVCRLCWFTLSAAARRALNRRDSKAGIRLLQLYRQLRNDVPLTEIRITP